MSEIREALKDRLRGEFSPESHSDELVARRNGAPAPSAIVFVHEDGNSVTVQALDFVTGDLAWQATFTNDSPLELILVTARSAADGDR